MEKTKEIRLYQEYVKNAANNEHWLVEWCKRLFRLSSITLTPSLFTAAHFQTWTHPSSI